VELEDEGEFCDESEMSLGATSFERKDVGTPVSGTERKS
jgi:hypothetical protein